MEVVSNDTFEHLQYLSKKDVETIVRKCAFSDEEVVIDNYVTQHASNKMLGFLSDYWKLRVNISRGNGHQEILNFFIKVISKSNAAKADMVREMKLYHKEIFFYNVLKDRMEVHGEILNISVILHNLCRKPSNLIYQK